MNNDDDLNLHSRPNCRAGFATAYKPMEDMYTLIALTGSHTQRQKLRRVLYKLPISQIML